MSEIRLATGRTLRPGTEFSISDQGGRFRFRSYDPRGWIEAYGGKPGRLQYRALAVDIDPASGEPTKKITVHRTNKLRGGR